MIPLNIYLDGADEEQSDHAVREYGNAIRELAAANIFPGDMLWKNFGVTRFGRVVFYDYDEIEFLTDVNFREMPTGRDGDDEEGGGEPSFYVGERDVFPEEFLTFMGLRGPAREAFLERHRDLLDVGFWLRTQRQVRSGEILDVFPYPEARRIRRGARPA
jgi:isocitrate dehydrogenase kinase/phosphatase